MPRDFRSNDKVYCPAIATKPFLTYTKEDTNGVFIRHRGIEYWFTVGGVPSNNSSSEQFPRVSLPSLFLGTETNRVNLSDLYDIDLKESVDINIYALNVTSSDGSPTNEWVFNSQEGYYDWHSPSEELIPSIETLRYYDILLSPHTEYLKAIDIEASTSIISVAKESIDIWCNLHPI